MSGKHRYIWLGVMLILCAVSIGAGTYLWQQNSRSAVNTKAKSAKTVTKAVRQDRGKSKEEILAMTLDGTIPCQVDTYKNENTIFLIRPNRGN
ncbi:hypothetical protein QUD83_08495, partial [Lacticaseibacillus paracasei]|nr:hypothetical protein [Lacticaseibacillus paracasei]MDM7541951.1 hypothetical protein [Lacticaseibacillus paracasei]